MKTISATIILATALIVSSGSVHALRCNGTIISEGDPVHKVERACPIEDRYQVQSDRADILKLYYSVGGMNYELIFIDGRLNTINESRF